MGEIVELRIKNYEKENHQKDTKTLRNTKGIMNFKQGEWRIQGHWSSKPVNTLRRLKAQGLLDFNARSKFITSKAADS
jgi:hypothetical protein